MNRKYDFGLHGPDWIVIALLTYVILTVAYPRVDCALGVQKGCDYIERKYDDT